MMHSAQTRSNITIHQLSLSIEISHSLDPSNEGVANCTFFACFSASLASILNPLRVLHIVGYILASSTNLWRMREPRDVYRCSMMLQGICVNPRMLKTHALLGDGQSVTSEMRGEHLFELRNAMANLLELDIFMLSELGDLVWSRDLWVRYMVRSDVLNIEAHSLALISCFV